MRDALRSGSGMVQHRKSAAGLSPLPQGLDGLAWPEGPRPSTAGSRTEARRALTGRARQLDGEGLELDGADGDDLIARRQALEDRYHLAAGQLRLDLATDEHVGTTPHVDVGPAALGQDRRGR